MCRLFPCISIFRGFFFLLKSVKKKYVCVLVLKVTLLLMKNLFFVVKKGMSELGVLVSCKTHYYQSKTAVFQLSRRVFILHSFRCKMRPWISSYLLQPATAESVRLLELWSRSDKSFQWQSRYVRIWANKISIKILSETFPHQNFWQIP